MTFWPALAALAAAALLAAAGINLHVWRSGSRLIRTVDNLNSTALGLVLGARVWPGNVPSAMLEDRLQVAALLWRRKRVEKLLLSGDNRPGHGEVDAMEAHLLALGVLPQDLLRDEAGLTTHTSLVRARGLFAAHSLTVITQGFHLPRALYSAQRLGLDAHGVPADLRPYARMTRNQVRETLARLKAFLRWSSAI
mgnify:CR=1 FL=1